MPSHADNEARRSATHDHWSELARLWGLSGPPLRVSPEDASAYWDALAHLIERRPEPRVLLLGVTPELFGLPWPEGTDFQAADRSEAMIDKVWAGPSEAVRHEDWTDLSDPDSSRDVVLCDGGLHLLSYPDGQARLVSSLRRVVSRDGLFVIRLFVPPARRESPAEVIEDLRAGRIDNVNALKMRLGMAIQQDPRPGVRLGDVWDLFHGAEPDPEDLSARIGWPVEQIRSVEAYRDSDSTYNFVTVDEVRDLFCREPGGFELESMRVPSYDLGERCPLVVFRRTE